METGFQYPVLAELPLDHQIVHLHEIVFVFGIANRYEFGSATPGERVGSKIGWLMNSVGSSYWKAFGNAEQVRRIRSASTLDGPGTHRCRTPRAVPSCC